MLTTGATQNSLGYLAHGNPDSNLQFSPPNFVGAARAAHEAPESQFPWWIHLYPLLKIFKGHFSLLAPTAFIKYLQCSVHSHGSVWEVEWMAVTSLWKSHLWVGQGSTAKATCHTQDDLRIKIKCHSPYTSVPLHLHVTIIISNSVTFLVPKKYSYALSSPKFDKLLWDLRSDIFFEGKMEKVPGKMSSASMRTN